MSQKIQIARRQITKNSKKQRKKIKVRILDSLEEDAWNGIKNKNICHTTQCNNPNPVHVHLVMTNEYAVNVAVNRTNGAFEVFKNMLPDGEFIAMTSDKVGKMCGHMLKTIPK